MSSRSAKRRKFSNMKNMLVKDVNELTLTSAAFIDELHAANRSFKQHFENMDERQSELFARTVGLDDQYGDLIDALKRETPITSGETSQQNVQIAPSYQEDPKKFLNDSCVSLNGHVNQFKEGMDEMLNTFHAFEEAWKKKMDDLKKKAEEMDEQKTTMTARIMDLTRNS